MLYCFCGASHLNLCYLLLSTLTCYIQIHSSSIGWSYAGTVIEPSTLIACPHRCRVFQRGRGVVIFVCTRFMLLEKVRRVVRNLFPSQILVQQAQLRIRTLLLAATATTTTTTTAATVITIVAIHLLHIICSKIISP